MLTCHWHAWTAVFILFSILVPCKVAIHPPLSFLPHRSLAFSSVTRGSMACAWHRQNPLSAIATTCTNLATNKIPSAAVQGQDELNYTSLGSRLSEAEKAKVSARLTVWHWYNKQTLSQIKWKASMGRSSSCFLRLWQRNGTWNHLELNFASPRCLRICPSQKNKFSIKLLDFTTFASHHLRFQASLFEKLNRVL